MQAHNFQPFQTTHARWRAITQRDPAAHFSFIYGVKTTKIYCRPTCTARIARRANVVYYENRDRAESDGFRPCTKCKPDDTAFIGQREEIVLRTLNLIRVRKDSVKVEGGLKELAKNVGVTPSYLCRVFKKTMGSTIGEYCRHFEVEVSESGATSSVGSPDTLVAEVPTWAMISEPLSTINRPLEPVDIVPESSNDHFASPSTGTEENVDLDFDYVEWFWTEGFDFNDWLVPNMGFSQDGVYG